VSTGRVTAIDDRDRGVRVGEQLVGEGHAGGAGADDEVVDVDLVVHAAQPNGGREVRAQDRRAGVGAT
jgi:hypothetical protein